MFNANESFETHFATLLDATRIHNSSTSFNDRVNAREVMTFAERKIAFAKRHVTFDIEIAAQTAMQLKMKQYMH